jgi:branched-chain amino acid transport system permease protein
MEHPPISAATTRCVVPIWGIEMDGFLHQLVAGIATGGIYASVALSLVMIYQATHLVNFAQGEMAMFSTYIALTLIQAGIPYWPALLITIVVSFVAGMAIERILMRPLAGAPVLASVGVFIGLLLAFNSLAGLIFSYTLQPFQSPFGEGPPLAGGLVSRHELGATAVTLSMLLLVYGFFRFTSLGLAMRAAAYNPVSSRLVGVPVGRMLALGWGLAAAIGAVAGVMVAPVVFLDPNMMSGVLLYAFAGALLGGITNPLGAVVGGFAVGVIENLGGAYVVGTELKLPMALVIIVTVLVLRPSGLFGRIVVSRV